MMVAQTGIQTSSDNDSARFLRTRSSNVSQALLSASLLYLLFGLFFLLFSDPKAPGLMLLHLGSACSLLLFWRLVRWGGARYDSFGAVMLLIAAMLKLQAALDAWVYGTRLDRIPSTVPLPNDLALLLLKSESLSLFGTLLLVSVWRIMVGQHVGQFSFLNNYRQVDRFLPRLMYVAAIFIELLRRVAGADFGALTQVSSMTFSFGVVSIFFIAAMQKSRHTRVVLALLLALPLAALAMGGGMKEAMFFPLVPAALLFWFGYPSLPLRATVVAIGFVLLAYSQMYVHYVRQVTWFAGVEMSASELVSGFQKNLANADFSQGMDSMSSRMNMTTSRAITVAIADARGIEPGNIFGAIPASLIPRIFWPGKPVLQPGAQHTFRIQNINAPASEATSATAAGFFSELYLGGGYVGWLIGALVYGYLLARIQLFTLRQMPGFGHLALSFAAMYWALRFEEKHVVYGFTSLFFIAVFLFLLLKAASMFGIKSGRVVRSVSRI